MFLVVFQGCRRGTYKSSNPVSCPPSAFRLSKASSRMLLGSYMFLLVSILPVRRWVLPFFLNYFKNVEIVRLCNKSNFTRGKVYSFQSVSSTSPLPPPPLDREPSLPESFICLVSMQSDNYRGSILGRTPHTSPAPESVSPAPEFSEIGHLPALG